MSTSGDGSQATLYIFAGLPGSGKSTLAQALARATAAVFLRIDSVEQGLRALCGVDVSSEGYRLAYRLAADNLRLGNDVVADSCNPVRITREEWRRVALDVGASFVDIEVVCSDVDEHRRRVESRASEVEGLSLPTWEQVAGREYHPFEVDRIVIDTASLPVETSVQQLLVALGA